MPANALRSCLPVLAPILLLLACTGGNPDQPAQVCAAVDCGAGGRCVVDGSQPACLCDPGNVAEGLSCIPAEEAGPCSPNPCRTFGRTRCIEEGTAAVCLCDEGRVLIGGECVVEGVCAPNPCSAPFQTVCRPEGDVAVCSCDPGHVPLEGGGCSADPAWNCDRVHTTGVPDVFEPDECPLKANELLAVDAPQEGHTINPAGDADWYRLDPDPGHVYRIRADGALRLAMYLDAYGADGTTPIAADHDGSPDATIHVKAHDAAPIFVRVKALRASDVGTYVITGANVGADDFGDSPSAAANIQAGASFDGTLQFAGDQDVFRLALVPGQAHGVAVQWTGQGDATLELLADDGTTLKQRVTGPNPEIVTLAGAQSAVVVRLRAHTPWAMGKYTISTSALGPDDHGDVAAEATPITTSKTSTRVSFDREGDNDLLSFAAIQDRIYSVRCTPTSGYGQAFGTLEDASGRVHAQQSYGSELLLAHEASETGMLFVRIRSPYQQSNQTAFGCILADLGTDDHGDDVTDATPLSPSPVTAVGILEEPGDKDVFSFTAVPGKVYRFDCTFNTSSPCALRLLNPGGAALQTGSNLAWEFSTGGTYHFEVGATYSTHGSYTFALLDLGTDDTGDDVQSARAVSADGLLNWGHLETVSDKDVFSFQATANHIYQFTCTPQTGASCSVQLLAPSGAAVGSATQNGAAFSMTHEVSVSGTYHAVVTTYGGSGASGYYTWILKDLGIDDHGDDGATATPIMFGTNEPGTLEYGGDTDTFTFAATADRVYRFRCTRGTATACPFSVTDGTGTTVVAANTYSNQTNEFAWEATATGPLVIHVGAAATNSYFKAAGTFTINVVDLGVDDHGDTQATATLVTLPMSSAVAAQLEANGDVDFFGFAAVKDRIYRTTCTLGTLSQCSMKVRNPFGTVVASSSYNVTTLTFVAADSGTYTVEVSHSTYASTTGTYGWSVEDAGEDDHANEFQAATALVLSTPITGEIQYAADVDVFAFPVTAGRIYGVSCNPQGSSYCYVRIATAANATIASGSPTVRFIPPASATTLYAIIQSNSSSAVTLSYSVIAEDLGVDDHGNTAAAASPMKLGAAAGGTLQYGGDLDVFAISLTAGVTYSLSVSVNQTIDVLIASPSGTHVARSSSSLTFTATTAGTYTVVVSPYASWSSLPIGYTLQMQ